MFQYLSFHRCEKKDTETKITLTGTVNNFTTDKGIGGVTVYFITRYNNKFLTQLATTSNADGSFTFNEAVKHSSSRYTYHYLIESKSGIGDIGFDGVQAFINGNQLDEHYTFYVVPSYKSLCIQLPNQTTVTSPDTITVYCEQLYFIKIYLIHRIV